MIVTRLKAAQHSWRVLAPRSYRIEGSNQNRKGQTVFSKWKLDLGTIGRTRLNCTLWGTVGVRK